MQESTVTYKVEIRPPNKGMVMPIKVLLVSVNGGNFKKVELPPNTRIGIDWGKSPEGTISDGTTLLGMMILAHLFEETEQVVGNVKTGQTFTSYDKAYGTGRYLGARSKSKRYLEYFVREYLSRRTRTAEFSITKTELLRMAEAQEAAIRKSIKDAGYAVPPVAARVVKV